MHNNVSGNSIAEDPFVRRRRGLHILSGTELRLFFSIGLALFLYFDGIHVEYW